MENLKIRWAHLTSPRGEGFQGFWIMTPNGQPINDRPFETKDAAKAALKGMN